MTAKKQSEQAAEPPFEDALARLDAIVKALEEGKLPLDEAIVHFEEGLQLVKACRAKLDAAELKVRELLEEREESG